MSLNLKLCLVLLGSIAVQQLVAEKNRIFDGQDLRPNVHKYLVKLKLFGQYEAQSFCSGSILNSRWIVTAAHCIKPELVKIYVQHFRRGDMKKIAKVTPKNIVWHPRYDFDTDFSETRAFDVALLKTRKNMKFNRYVQPIKLAAQAPELGQSAIIAGYGESKDLDVEGKEGAVILTECPNHHKGLLCSESLVSAGDGDSGGALVSVGRLAGVTTASCLHTYESRPCLTMYVNIAENNNMKWIKKVITT